MVTATPGLIIAGTASGTGKTTIATGLMAALARRMTVAPFKVGPDYIDPGYHGLATGLPGRNLDAVLCGESLIGPLYRHGSAGADIAIVEGVMGLFDGRISDNPAEFDTLAEGSTARIAQLIDLPIVLVVDVHGMSHTVGPLVRGFATFAPGVRIAGVILNRVGSTRHAAICRAAIEAQGIPVVGEVPRVRTMNVPSRHLGLITTAEWTDPACEAVAAMADRVEESVDLDAIISLARCGYTGPAFEPAAAVNGGTTSSKTVIAATNSAGGVSAESSEALANPCGKPADSPPTVVITGGPAFSFSYAEHRELLQAAGARVVDLDPLGDEDLALEHLAQADALIIPGGFPEEHADELAARRRLCAAVRDAAESGMPIHAECAGLLWLVRTLDGHPMCNVVPADAQMSGRLTLGYRSAVALGDSALWPAGARVTGHEFHHTSVTWHDDVDHSPAPAWAWRGWGGANVREGWIGGPKKNVHASYLHVHPAAQPEAIRALVEAAREFAAARSAREGVWQPSTPTALD